MTRNVGKICTEHECETGAYCRTLCRLHYYRLMRYGSTAEPKGRTRKAHLCSTCGEADPSKFYGQERGTCAACRKERSIKWNNDNPTEAKAIRRRTTLWTHYRLTTEDYAAMLRHQGGVCAACGEPPTKTGGGNTVLVVDHDHSCCPGIRSCGRCVRGLLCNGCNRAIGWIQDSSEKAKGIADYLEKHSGVAVATGTFDALSHLADNWLTDWQPPDEMTPEGVLDAYLSYSRG